MRILVISDSHGGKNNIRKAILSQPSARHIFFLGDNLSDIEEIIYEFPDKYFYTVSGNCDFGSTVAAFGTEILNNIKIFYTHGAKSNVKYSLDTLGFQARKENADLVLYGHTHISAINYIGGVYYVNPGSVSCSRNGPNSYAVIDITEKGILPAIIKI